MVQCIDCTLKMHLHWVRLGYAETCGHMQTQHCWIQLSFEAHNPWYHNMDKLEYTLQLHLIRWRCRGLQSSEASCALAWVSVIGCWCTIDVHDMDNLTYLIRPCKWPLALDAVIDICTSIHCIYITNLKLDSNLSNMLWTCHTSLPLTLYTVSYAL